MATGARARESTHARKTNGKITRLRLVKTSKKRAKERGARSKAFETEHFGRPPPSATHLQLRRIATNGTVEKLLVNEGGFEKDKFDLARVSTDWIRRTFGAGTYRGNWFAVKEGRWTPLGQMQTLRLSTSTGTDVRAETRARSRGRSSRAGFAFAVPSVAGEAAGAGAELGEERAIVNARVRAEREIAEMRIRTMAELQRSRLEGLEEQHRREMRDLERRLDEMDRRAEEQQEEDPDEPGPPPPATWLDLVRPLIEQAIPMLQQALPVLAARMAGAPVGVPLPEKKGG